MLSNCFHTWIASSHSTPTKNSKIILDAKSGISGAGKSSVENGLEEEIKENFKSYNVGFHRHQPK